MKLIDALDQGTIVNLALVQSIELNHHDEISTLTFAFADYQYAVWRFAERKRAEEVLKSIRSSSAQVF